MKANTKRKLSFPGGAHPPQSKELTLNSKIAAGPAVKQVAIMLSQHIGAPCQPLVEKKQQVRAGDKIGDCDGFVSAPVHSPVNGTVKEIALQSHAVLGRSMAIIIDADTENNPPKQPCFEKFTADLDIEDFSGEQICEAIRRAGLVGMGGAGFPTRVKVEPNPQMPKETLIINACECEPYITCDYRVMLEWTNQLVAGIKLAKKASDCSKAFIAIEDNKPEAIRIITETVKNSSNCENVEVVAVKTKYPQGGERQLIKSVLDKTVSTGGIPPMIGVMVLNVATACAIAEAVILNTPLTHRVTTVTGEGITKPGNFYVPIGTPIGELIDFCGGLRDDAARVILGGPMMGLAVSDLSTPVTKTTGAITILTREQIGSAKFAGQQTPCIRCGRCLEVCPEHINPTKIAHAVKHNLIDVAQSYYMSACIECGCCSYVCPANIELTGLIKTGKILVARAKKKVPQ